MTSAVWEPGFDCTVGEEITQALASISLAIEFVVDCVDDDVRLERPAREATTAVADALFYASGRPSDRLWATARAYLARFVRAAESDVRSSHGRHALHTLRSFVEENDDLR